MSRQVWEELLLSPVIDATQISNTTAETIMVPDTTIPANFFLAGRTLRVRMMAALSNVVTTPGTITFRVRWGGVSGTVLCASAAIAMNTTAKTNSTALVEFHISCRVEANPGTLFAWGWVNLGASDTTAYLQHPVPDSGPASVGSLDLTTATSLSFTAQFSVNTSPTNWLTKEFKLESLN
jgi:hypothetical protein